MVKTGVLKTIKNNISFRKSIIILGLLALLAVVLFSLLNNYSVENFTPKPNAKIEVMIWTDDNGSLDNTFVKNEWLELVAKYEKYATFGYGSLTEYVTYVNRLTKSFGKNIDKKYTQEDFKSFKDQLPFVSMVVEIDKVRDYVGYAIGSSLTTENIKNTLFLNINKYYRNLYSDAHISTPTPIATAPTAVAAAPPAPAVAAPAAAPTAPSWMKLPGT
jgi:hypothetical protein